MRRERTKIAISPPQGLSGPEGSAGPHTTPHPAAREIDREHLLDRLANLRATLPALAPQLASARRQRTQLRVENRGLLEQVRRLRERRGEDRYSVDEHR